MKSVWKTGIVSPNGKKYAVRISNARNSRGLDSITCYVFRKFLGIPIYVYKEKSYRILLGYSLQEFTVRAIRSYEYLKGYGSDIHSTVDEFNEWDGKFHK